MCCLWITFILEKISLSRLAGLVNKEDIELKETFFGDGKANGINGHHKSNENDGRVDGKSPP